MTNEQPLYTYTRNTETDFLLIQWFLRLKARNEDELTFGRSAVGSVYDFLAFFQTKELLFKSDLQLGLWLAGWFEPVFDGAFAGLWVHPERRKSRRSLAAVEEILAHGLSKYALLLGVTKQPRLIDGHRRLGYNLLGQLPKLFDGSDAWVLTLTPDGFQQRSTHSIQRSRKEAAWEAVENRA